MTLSFRKYALTGLLAAGAFAATPAQASFANFQWMQGKHDTKIIYSEVPDNHDAGVCQGWTCNNNDKPSDGPHWDNPPNDGPPNWDGPHDTPVSGVPEPATWAMFLLGFGGIGFMLRRERLKQVAAVASR